MGPKKHDPLGEEYDESVDQGEILQSSFAESFDCITMPPGSEWLQISTESFVWQLRIVSVVTSQHLLQNPRDVKAGKVQLPVGH
jgi:hypothetical protein